MKSYPSIEHTVSHDIPVYVFDKLDGSNIRAEWTRKQKQFTKFGSRNVLLDENGNTELAKSIPLIREHYEKHMTDIFLKKGYQEAVCFFEFFGPSSFAGFHEPEEPKKVVLFDINVHKQGLIYPGEFVKLTRGLVEIPTILHMGKTGTELFQQVAESRLEGMTFEGVVCKSISPTKKGYPPFMYKYKSQAWLQRLKQFANGNTELENQLK